MLHYHCVKQVHIYWAFAPQWLFNVAEEVCTKMLCSAIVHCEGDADGQVFWR